jgi:hypothetical protein
MLPKRASVRKPGRGQKGALVYLKRTAEGIHRTLFLSQRVEQADQFIADQAGVERKEYGQKQSGSEAIEKL